jgi:hypothetical protein
MEELPRLRPEAAKYWLTRAILLRALGLIYGVAFLILVFQWRGLIGSHGILPAQGFLRFVDEQLGAGAFTQLPGLFWITCSDRALQLGAFAGLGLSLAAVLGRGSAVVFAGLWLLQLSFASVGQIFWGYGWELLLLELGFLAIFASPGVLRTRRAPFPPNVLLVFLFRWVLFRVLFGAGLIKLRGDECWTALTCLATHYETQPNPGPLSLYFHALPLAAHRAGAVFNHLVELVVPFGVFGPRRVRTAAGALAIAFQTILILSGNLSFLNWLTIVPALACFDDRTYARVLPGFMLRHLRTADGNPEHAEENKARLYTVRGFFALILVLSIAPTVNLVMPHQVMNGSFDPLHLVNTYGAFGSVDAERHEVIIEGTRGDPLAGEVRWEEYEFPCKPGRVDRRPCLVTPYHYRLDWQMWFAGHRQRAGDAWFFKLIIELLRGNRDVTALLSRDPFADGRPRYVRALLYHYRFVHPGQAGYWTRELIGEYLRPISLDDADVRAFLEARPWMAGE